MNTWLLALTLLAPLALNDTSRHFTVWDDPRWMFTQMDAFPGGL